MLKSQHVSSEAGCSQTPYRGLVYQHVTFFSSYEFAGLYLVIKKYQKEKH